MNSLRSGLLAIGLALLLPAGATLAQDAPSSPVVEPTMSPDAQEFADAFPDEIGGVALAGLVQIADVSQPDAFDPTTLPLITELADGLGIGFEDILAASAMTFDDLFAEEPTGVWIMALKAPGMAPEAGVALMVELWTLEADGEALVISETQVAQRDVTRIASAEDPEAAFVVYGSDDIAWMVASPDEALVEETISKLP